MLDVEVLQVSCNCFGLRIRHHRLVHQLGNRLSFQSVVSEPDLPLSMLKK